MTPTLETKDLTKFVRDIPDFPKKGIAFKDITPLLKDPGAFRSAIDAFAARYEGRGIRLVAGIESRGFLLASAVALRLGAGVIPIRKKGKLPHKTLSASYDLEYGTDSVEIHADAAARGDKVLLIDDVIATGGTARAACELIEKLGAEVAGVAFLIELSFLKGREKLGSREIFALIGY
ncbi:MAG: adenine phosphoribosyltransferase [Elusimicrobia bacterium GWA2_69_24]|nr:MAG: adenine phosphoribosyltransferase [Elusimicrobia bacterium GWA2_69_24]HBL16761.1 adenine phosphoribosyltransferase [Elusimicrobiota bacterium]